MNQQNISRTLSRRLEVSQYNNVFNIDLSSIDLSSIEETGFSFFVGYSDSSNSFQMTVYF